MRKRNRLTSHGKKRISERINATSKTTLKLKPYDLSRIAYMNGKSKDDFEGKFKQYIESKSKKGRKVKIYSNYVYIYSNKKLLTLFAVPDKYLPIQQYEKNNILNKIDLYYDKLISIKCFNDDKFEGIIDKEYKSEYNNKLLLSTEYGKKFIKLKHIKKIRPIK